MYFMGWHDVVIEQDSFDREIRENLKTNKYFIECDLLSERQTERTEPTLFLTCLLTADNKNATKE